MSTLLQTYEEDFKESVRRADEELTAIQLSCSRDAVDYTAPPASGPMSRVRRCGEVQRLLAHLRELLGNMEYESHDVPASQRQTLRHRMNEYLNSVTRLESTMENVKTCCGIADRQDLLGNNRQQQQEAGGPSGEADEEHRRIMMDNTNKFRDASDKLQQAERVLTQTEALGTTALENLREQTEQLQGMHEVTLAVDDEISESRKILQKVYAGMVKQKATLIAIAVVLMILIIVAIYVSVAKHRRTTPTAPSPATTSPPIPPTQRREVDPHRIPPSSSRCVPFFEDEKVRVASFCCPVLWTSVPLVNKAIMVSCMSLFIYLFIYDDDDCCYCQKATLKREPRPTRPRAAVYGSRIDSAFREKYKNYSAQRKLHLELNILNLWSHNRRPHHTNISSHLCHHSPKSIKVLHPFFFSCWFLVMLVREHLQEIAAAHTRILQRTQELRGSAPVPSEAGTTRLFALDPMHLRAELTECEEALTHCLSNTQDASVSLLHRLAALRGALQSPSQLCVALSNVVQQAAIVFVFFTGRVLPATRGALQRLGGALQRLSCEVVPDQRRTVEGKAGGAETEELRLEMERLLSAFRCLLQAPFSSSSSSAAAAGPRLRTADTALIPSHTQAASRSTTSSSTQLLPSTQSGGSRFSIAISAAYLTGPHSDAALLLQAVQHCAEGMPRASLVLLCGVPAEEENTHVSHCVPPCCCLVTPHPPAAADRTLPRRLTLAQLLRGLDRRRTLRSTTEPLDGATAAAATEPLAESDEEAMRQFEAVLDALVGEPSAEEIEAAAARPGTKRGRGGQAERLDSRQGRSPSRPLALSGTPRDDAVLVDGARQTLPGASSQPGALRAASMASAADDLCCEVVLQQMRDAGADLDGDAWALLSSQVVAYGDGPQRHAAPDAGRSRTRETEEEPFMVRQRNIDAVWDAICPGGDAVAAAGRWLFQVSISVGETNRHEVIDAVLALGSRVDTGSGFHPGCTHLVVGDGHPERSEKFLCACAAGALMVAPSYVLRSRDSGEWLCARQDVRDGDCNPMRAVRCAPGKIFTPWRVVLFAEDVGVMHGIQHVLVAGGCTNVVGLLCLRPHPRPAAAGEDEARFKWYELDPGARESTSQRIVGESEIMEAAAPGGGGALDHATHLLVESRVFSRERPSNFAMPPWMPPALWSTDSLYRKMFSLDLLHYCLCTRSVEVCGGRVFDDTGAAMAAALPPLKCRLITTPPPAPVADPAACGGGFSFSSTFEAHSSLLGSGSG
eukprot:gene9742-6830_t